MLNDAREPVMQRERRVTDLCNLINSVRFESARLDAVLAGIATELVERPLKVIGHPDLAPAASPDSYRDPVVAAELIESLHVLEEVRALQVAAHEDAICDVATVVRKVSPMLHALFGPDVDIRVSERGGPFVVPLADWCMAIVVLSIAVALASTPEDSSEDRDASKHDADAEPRSVSAHYLGDPLPGRAAVFIRLVGMGDSSCRSSRI
jgi:hypothetical protein